MPRTKTFRNAAERQAAYRDRKLRAEEEAAAWRAAHPKGDRNATNNRNQGSKAQEPQAPPQGDLQGVRHKIWTEVFAPEPPNRSGRPYFPYPRFSWRCECERTGIQHGPYLEIDDLEYASQKHCLGG
jgi:hypothetical protein